MPKSYTTFNWDVLGLVENIRRLAFQWDMSHMRLKYESTRITEKVEFLEHVQVLRHHILDFGSCIMFEHNRGTSRGLPMTLRLYYVPPPPY
jgi:hypothetical protein